MIDLFSIVWLSLVAFIGYWNFKFWYEGKQTGVATYYFRYRFSREEKPFEFRMLQLMRVAGMAISLVMFLFGLQFVGA